jgi:hypothetical protein
MIELQSVSKIFRTDILESMRRSLLRPKLSAVRKASGSDDGPLHVMTVLRARRCAVRSPSC